MSAGNERTGRLLTPLAQVCSLLAAFFGLTALLGWVLGLPLLSSFGRHLRPMAPSTALLFLLYGAGAFVLARSPHNRAVQRVGLFMGSLGALAALLLLFFSSLGIHPEAEYLGFRIVGMINGVPIGHMSPLTGFCFVLVGLSFLASLPSSSGRRWWTATVFGGSFLIVLISIALLIAYLLESPLLYDSSVIPPGLSASVAFLALGIALLSFSRQRIRTQGRLSDAPGARATYALILIFVITATGIVAAGYVYFRNLEKHYRAGVERQLSVIGELKVEEIAQWKKERLRDAAVFYKNVEFSRLVKRCLETSDNVYAQVQLQLWMIQFHKAHQYDRISLYDADGIKRAGIPHTSEPMDSRFLQRISEVLHSGQIAFNDFYRDEHDQRVYLNILVPILDTDQNSRAIGILQMRIDPEAYLYPLINRWPTPSRTAETLIIRRDGNDALFLNELKYKKGTALTLRIPLDREEVTAVKAALGQTGIMEGWDYRGVPVIADVRAIPGSPWFLIARIDAAEVYAPLRERLWEIVILISALLICAAAGVGFVWRHQLTHYYRERYKASEALRQSEARFHRLAENAQDLIYRYDFAPRQGFAYLNPAVTAITGYTQDDFYADPQLRNKIVHPEDRHLLEAATHGGFPSGEPLTLRWVRKDGTLIWVELRRVPVLDDRGNLIAVEGIARDITERKLAQEALAKSEHRFRALFENMSSGVAVYEAVDAGVDFVFKDFNAAGARIEQTPKEAVIGQRVTEVFPGVGPMGLLEVFSRVWKTGKPEHYPMTFYKDEKHVGWRENYVYKLYSGEIVAVYDDITERKLAGEKIENLNRTLRAVRDINQMIVHEKDPQKLIQRTAEILVEHRAYGGALLFLTDESGKTLTPALAGMKEVFHSMVEHLRKGVLPPCCEAAQLNGGFLCVPDQADACAPYPIAPDGDPCDVICIRLQHDKRTYGYLAGSVAHAVRVDPEERALFVEMASDVAFALHNIELEKTMRKMHEERDRFEAELRQAQKMEAIGALAGGIAHDFNNILTAVIGFTQLAEQDVDKDSLTYRNLQEVLKASARAKDLVKQILTFSRQAAQEFQPVQVKLIVKETLKLIRASLPSTIEIIQDIKSDAMVWSDPTQVHQIMMNLCTNAAYAMREKGGTLEVSLKDIEQGADLPPRHPDSKPGRYLLLQVTDTGHGISPSIVDRIFEPFFTTKKRGEGTGMGLAAVHGIVKNLGGFVTVYSEVGKGSSFKVYMPAMSLGKKPEPLEEPPLLKGKERILFVDDEPALVDLGKQFLERLGYQVTSRTSSIEALSLFQARPKDFDLVIADLTMPKMTGEELALEILNIRKDLPVILCTGFSTKLAEERAKEVGVCAFVMKPLVVADLARAVRQCLDHKK